MKRHPTFVLYRSFEGAGSCCRRDRAAALDSWRRIDSSSTTQATEPDHDD